jgi:hypothetical protein
LVAVAACGPPGGTPTNSPVGGATRTADVDAVPQPSLATLDLGTDGPGFDGTGTFFSYDSDLTPEAALGAYAAQLIEAGFHDIGSQGAWRMFIGPNLTVWFRVGSGGPPTSLLVRIQASTAADSDIGDPRTSSGSTSGTVSGQGTLDGPKATPRTTSQRRPDPPHGGTGAATATGGGRGGTTGSGTATGGTSGTGTTSGGGSVTGGGTTGGGTTGGSSGTGTDGGDDGLRP